MRLLNWRTGFACNSSSTHSVVLVRPGTHNQECDDDTTEWGWEWFLATSKQAKLSYFYSQLMYSLREYCDSKMAEMLIQSYGAKSFENQRSVDHQSAWNFPRKHNSNFLDLEFALKIRDELLLNNNLAIYGGNDNSNNRGNSSVIKEIDFKLGFESSPNRFGVVSRYDKAGYWIIFDQRKGTRLRLQFSDMLLSEIVPAAAVTPELVDIKITESCGKRCSFCYQDSLPHGKHANPENLHYLFNWLGEVGVLEVALGGGEPTEHPEILQILDSARENDIVPNLTTANYKIVEKEIFHELCKRCGAIAFSVLNHKQAEEVALIASFVNSRAYAAENAFDIIKWHDCSQEGYKRKILPIGVYPLHAKIVIQIPMGVVPMDEFIKILEICAESQLSVTCLGYKAIGRAAMQPPEPYPWWFNVISKKQDVIGIDTVLAREFKKDLLQNKSNKNRITWEEGAFSCYMDAVQGIAYKSSYERTNGVPIKFLDMRDIIRNLDPKHYAIKPAWTRPRLNNRWADV